MLFDERPKETLQDFYNREKELEELKRAIGRPIIVLAGGRKIGKTSMLKVFLSECTFPNALVDVYQYSDNPYKSFSVILTQLNKKSIGKMLSDALKNIAGVSIHGIEIELSWKKVANLQDIFDQVNSLGKKVIIGIDGAENFRGKFEKNITSLLAHCYDYCKNITFIITGTEIGLVYEIFNKPDSPLFDRYIERVQLKPFSKSMSTDFLKKGFSQYKMNVEEDLIDYATDRLGGVVGRLVELGSMAVRRGVLTKELIDEVAERAALITRIELDHYPPKYRYVIKAIASGCKSLGEIKEFLKRNIKSEVKDYQLYHILNMLMILGYITKDEQGNYEILDPIIKVLHIFL
jgi:AAA+ ATPase superfamily predicted ATPase